VTKVLVATATRHGATEELAQCIARTIAANGVAVDVRRIDEVASVRGYDALVLGSAVYMGKWLAAARRFVERHRDEIANRPTWLFSSGPVGDGNGSEEFDGTALVTETRARDHHLFGGRLEKRLLTRRERAITRLLRIEDTDRREWDAAVAWATAIARSLPA
jgi:menaquinone-dependent protoporphyrinogen oxidase